MNQSIEDDLLKTAALTPDKPASTHSYAPAVSASSLTARIDRLPANRHVWMLVLLLSLGGFFEIYDIFLTGYIAPGIAKSGILKTTTAAFFGMDGMAGFIAVMFAGLFVGTFGLGWLPDRYGRRTVFTLSLLWYSISSAIMATQDSANGLLFWRFMTGIGVGVEIVTIDTYVVELVPQHMRGRAMAFNQMIMFVAAPAVALLSYFLVPTSVLGVDGWRWVVLIGSGGAIVVWFIRRVVPESPRWLAQSGRVEEARAIIADIEERVQRETGKPLPPLPVPVESPLVGKASMAELLRAPYRSRLLMLVVFNFFQAIGLFGFANWVPTLLIGQGITVTKSLLYAFIIAIAYPAGALITMLYADRVQRKWLIVGAAIAVLAFGGLFSQMREPVLLIVLGVLITVSSVTLSAIFHAYQAELFPTPVRARAGGLAYSASRVGAMLSGFLIAFLLRNFGVVGVFMGISAAMLVVALSIGLFGPKANGLRLEEV